jgi:HNH endonuclease
VLDDLNQNVIKALFSYDPEEGLLRWRNPAGVYGRIPAGSIAGSTTNKEGYRYVSINGKLYRGSRLIWVYMTGEWPKFQVDHKDRNTGNDKWDNLRLATCGNNQANKGKQKSKKRKPTSMLKGVQAVKKARGIRYRAIATKDGVREHLGYFDTEELAHAAYLKRSKELHGEFASDGKPPD